MRDGATCGTILSRCSNQTYYSAFPEGMCALHCLIPAWFLLQILTLKCNWGAISALMWAPHIPACCQQKHTPSCFFPSVAKRATASSTSCDFIQIATQALRLRPPICNYLTLFNISGHFPAALWGKGTHCDAFLPSARPPCSSIIS